jgi:hypothetical protein
VGLSHPDLFAGVVPIGGAPQKYAIDYSNNGQYLPFFAVCGDMAGPVQSSTVRQFRTWIMRSYPMIYVQYKGRGAEWFSGEVPFLFDWMNRKRRANPAHQLGRYGNGGSMGSEFQTMRVGDNRFYWIGVDEISSRYVHEPSRNRQPAYLCATNRDNSIVVHTGGVKRITIWLSRDMVDFTRKVSIVVNHTSRSAKLFTPSAEVMLEDFYERADRQRLFVAKEVCD